MKPHRVRYEARFSRSEAPKDKPQASNPTASIILLFLFILNFRLIDADPVNGHGLGENGGFIRPAGPFAPNRDIEEEVEFLMKWSPFWVSDGGAGVGYAVNEPLDLVLVPDNFKEVKVVGEGAVGELVLGRGKHGVFVVEVGVMDIGFDDGVVV